MVLHPVGPLPVATYWRRRLVLLVALVVLLLVARSCVGGGADRSGTTPTPTPTVRTTHSPSPRPSPTRAAGPVACDDGALELTTATDAKQYQAGATPRITLTVKNVSSATCRRELGDSALEVLVYSGSDRIWSSDDCNAQPGTAVQALRPGATLETTKTWDGKRSAQGCSDPRREASPGTYTVRAHVGTLTSKISVFRISS